VVSRTEPNKSHFNPTGAPQIKSTKKTAEEREKIGSATGSCERGGRVE
jgi:hypothetical protein